MTRVDVDPDRAARAARAILDGRASVERGTGGRYRVSSFTGSETYTVALEPEPRCSCPDSTYRGATCKHIAAALLHERSG